MNPEQLRAIGEAIYGDRWQSPLAADLGVADRTIRRWLAGDREIPDGLPSQLKAIVVQHKDKLEKVLAIIAKIEASAKS